MFSFLCKIWMFVLKLIDAIVDGLVHVIKGLVGALVEIVSALWDGISSIGGSMMDTTLGKVIVYGLLGLAGYWLYGLVSGDDEDDA